MTFVPVATLEDVLRVGAARPSPAACRPARRRADRPTHAGDAAAFARTRRMPARWIRVDLRPRRLLHLRPRLRPCLAADRDHQRARARGGPTSAVLLRTSAPRWLFDRTVRAAVRSLDDRHCDTGVVQIDSLRLDAGGDDRAGARVLRDARRARGGRGRACCSAHDVRLRGRRRAAARPARPRRAAGVPSVVVVELHLGLDLRGVPRASRARAGADPHDPGGPTSRRTPRGGCRCTAALRPFEHDRATLPFVARHAPHDAGRDARARSGCPAGRPRSSWPRSAATASPGTRRSSAIARTLERQSWHAACGRVPDRATIHERAGCATRIWSRAVDVVVTKPGYGIISRVHRQRHRALYTSRGHFVEYDVLVREMPRYLRCAYLENDALLAGHWRDALDRRVDAPAAARDAARPTAPR